MCARLRHLLPRLAVAVVGARQTAPARICPSPPATTVTTATTATTATEITAVATTITAEATERVTVVATAMVTRW